MAAVGGASSKRSGRRGRSGEGAGAGERGSAAGERGGGRKAARCAVRCGMVASLPGAGRLPCRSSLAVLPLLHLVWSVPSLCVLSLLVGALPFPPCGAGGCGRPSDLTCKAKSKVLPHQPLPGEGCTGLWRVRFGLVWGCGGLEAKGSPPRRVGR